MDIHLYDYSFTELFFTDRVISANLKLCFNDVGTGEYHFDIDNPILKTLLENKYLFIYQDNAEYELWSVVVGISVGEDIAVFCRTLNWFLTKMLSPPVGGSEAVTVSEKVSQIFENRKGCDILPGDFPADDERTFYFRRDGYGILFNYISEALTNINAGHEVVLDADKKLYFNMLSPSETELFISVDDGNASKIEISRDVIDFCNAGFFENKNESNDTSEWTEYSSGEEEKLKQWYSLLEGSNVSEAQADLLKKSVNNKTIATAQRLNYLSDYKLGDIVNIQIENENEIISVRQQIASVQLDWDENGFTQQPTLTELNEI